MATKLGIRCYQCSFLYITSHYFAIKQAKMVGWLGILVLLGMDWGQTVQTNSRTFSGSGTMHVVLSYGRRLIAVQKFREWL